MIHGDIDVVWVPPTVHATTDACNAQLRRICPNQCFAISLPSDVKWVGNPLRCMSRGFLPNLLGFTLSSAMAIARSSRKCSEGRSQSLAPVNQHSSVVNIALVVSASPSVVLVREVQSVEHKLSTRLVSVVSMTSLSGVPNSDAKSSRRL